MRTALRLPAQRVASLTAAISAALAATHAAQAQQLEEIIVTAERRELNLQDTPISVMSFDGEGLELRGIDDMFELATIAPNLDIKGSRGTGNTSPIFQIRGISSGGGATGERSVGYYVDNVFMPRTTGPVMRLIDVERVEVLRGPQGTLFGRNAIGGTINIVTRQPTNTLETRARLTVGNFEKLRVEGAISGPLVRDRIMGSFAFLRGSRDGFVVDVDHPDHPLGSDFQVSAHHDFLRNLGARERAAQVLAAGLERFPESWSLHARLRAQGLEERGIEGLESVYGTRLAAPGRPPSLEWFAGYASLVTAEYYRRAGNPAEALAAYDRAVAHYE